MDERPLHALPPGGLRDRRPPRRRRRDRRHAPGAQRARRRRRREALVRAAQPPHRRRRRGAGDPGRRPLARQREAERLRPPHLRRRRQRCRRDRRRGPPGRAGRAEAPTRCARSSIAGFTIGASPRSAGSAPGSAPPRSSTPLRPCRRTAGRRGAARRPVPSRSPIPARTTSGRARRPPSRRTSRPRPPHRPRSTDAPAPRARDAPGRRVARPRPATLVAKRREAQWNRRPELPIPVAVPSATPHSPRMVFETCVPPSRLPRSSSGLPPSPRKDAPDEPEAPQPSPTRCERRAPSARPAAIVPNPAPPSPAEDSSPRRTPGRGSTSRNRTVTTARRRDSPYNPGTSPDLVVFFDAGGACWDATSCLVQNTAVHGPIGAPQFAASLKNMPGTVLDRIAPNNPFATASLVDHPVLHGRPARRLERRDLRRRQRQPSTATITLATIELAGVSVAHRDERGRSCTASSSPAQAPAATARC